MKQERKEALGFWLVWQEFDYEARQPQGFLSKLRRVRIGSNCILPPSAIGGIDRVQHGLKAIWKFVHFGHFKRDASIPNLRLCANEPLAHGSGRDKESRGNPCGFKSEYCLQHQRRSGRGIDGWMRTDKQEFEPLVGENRSLWCHLVSDK